MSITRYAAINAVVILISQTTEVMAIAPAQALAVGYNVQTFGPNVTIESNWFRFDSGVNVTQNANGSVTIRGGNNTWGQQLQTALPTSGTTYSGNVFTGGGYFEATMSFTGNPSISGGWPSFWMQDIEMAENNGGEVKQPAINRWSTINIAEWADDHKPMSSPNIVFHDFHDFYGVVGRTWADADTGYHDNGSPYTLPVGFDLTQPHKYGFLWVPATATSRGFATFYIDDVQVDSNNVATWNMYSPATPPPPVKGSTAWSYIATVVTCS